MSLYDVGTREMMVKERQFRITTVKVGKFATLSHGAEMVKRR
jgi:hypothetical protein